MKKAILSVLVSLIVVSAFGQHWGPSAFGNRFGNGRHSVSTQSQGYRGMVELGQGFGWGSMSYVAKVTTTHGYMFNPYLYLGGFVSLGTCEAIDWEYYVNTNDFYHYTPFNFRLGADFRTYMSKGKVAPFVGVQLGLDLYGNEPFVYFSGQAGIRFALKNKLGLNFALQIGSSDYFAAGEVIFKLGFEF